MKPCLVVVFTALLVAGCASQTRVTTTYMPDGRKGYAIKCRFKNWGACVAKAGELCREQGYTTYHDPQQRRSGVLLIACGEDEGTSSH